MGGRVGIHLQALQLQSGLSASSQYLFSTHCVPSSVTRALPAAAYQSLQQSQEVDALQGVI